MVWVKKRKGSADIYTKDGISHAIVDRRNLGVSSALGYSITYKDEPFKSIQDAMRKAETDSGVNIK